MNIPVAPQLPKKFQLEKKEQFTNISDQQINQKFIKFKKIDEDINQNLPNKFQKENLKNFEDIKKELQSKAIQQQKERESFQLHQKFSEKDYKFIQISDLDNLDAISYCYQHKKFQFISEKSAKEACSIQGFAKISPSFRRSFSILKGTKIESQDQYMYIRAPDQKISPFLNQLLKRQNILELTAINKNLSTFDLKNIPTTNEIKKRAEILAKLYIKYNLIGHIEKNKKIEDMKILEAKLQEQEQQRKEKEKEMNKLTQQQQLDKEKKQKEEQEKKNIEKLDLNKMENEQKCKQEDEQKILLIEQYYEEIMNVLDEKIYQCFLQENYQQTFKLKKYKENLNEKYKKKEQDIEQTLKQLVIFKLEHSDIF